MYALVDCNTFYASCEQIFNPSLREKPIAVLSNNDGCVISLSKEAKAFNIPAYVPFYQVRDIIEKNQVRVFSSNYELYGDISAKVMQLLQPYCTEMEVYSIDEAFLRLAKVDYQSHGNNIKEMLYKQAKMPVCVGIAPTKTLAKLANHAAKKISRLNGVCVLDKPYKVEWLLRRIGPDKIWGVGNKLTKRLNSIGIYTAWELAQADKKYLRRRFSVVLERTIRELNGEPCLDLELDLAPKKEIICSRSFSYKITQLAELQQAISLYATRAGEKLRKQNGLTANLWIYLESVDKTHAYLRHQKVLTLPHLTNDTRTIAKHACKALSEIFQAGSKYKKCGIGLLDIRRKKYEQADLFNPQQTEQSRTLMTVLDKVNQRYGKHTLNLINAGIQPKWSMKRDYLSPAYSTKWSDIPTVRC